MTTTLEKGAAVAALFAANDDRAARLIDALRAEGVRLADGGAADATILFASHAALASDDIVRAVLAAPAQQRLVVLTERLDLPGDLPEALKGVIDPAAAIPAWREDEPETRRRILAALIGFGAAGAGVEAAQGASLQTEAVSRETAQASLSSSARSVPVDPMAKVTASVVKTSSRRVRLLAYGGAAAASVLVVGAVVFMQAGGDRARGSSSAAGEGAKTASAAPSRPQEPGAPPAPTPAAIETGGARVTLAQPSYPVGRVIPVHVRDMPGHQQDYVAIAAKGSPGYGEIRYEYLRGAKNADLVLRGVMKPGEYEVRLFFGNDTDRNKSETIRYAIPLIIAPADPVTLEVEGGATLTEGRPINVHYAGLPENQRDWVALSEAGSEDGAYISYVYSNGAAAGIARLPGATKPGKYEIRVYFDDIASDRTVQARLPLDVAPAPPVNLQLDANAYAPDAPIIVNFNSMPGNQKDWIALARAGDEGYLNYEYTDGASSGTLTIRGPSEPGRYEIRAYFDDATGDRTVRATASFEVTSQ